MGRRGGGARRGAAGAVARARALLGVGALVRRRAGRTTAGGHESWPGGTAVIGRSERRGRAAPHRGHAREAGWGAPRELQWRAGPEGAPNGAVARQCDSAGSAGRARSERAERRIEGGHKAAAVAAGRGRHLCLPLPWRPLRGQRRLCCCCWGEGEDRESRCAWREQMRMKRADRELVPQSHSQSARSDEHADEGAACASMRGARPGPPVWRLMWRLSSPSCQLSSLLHGLVSVGRANRRKYS